MPPEPTIDRPGALVKRKAVIKGQLTKIANFVNERDCDIDGLNSRLSKVHELYNQFIATEDKLFQLDSEAASEMEDLDDQYFPLVTKIQSLIRKFNLQPITKLDDSMDHSVLTNFKSDFKLPRLTLPTFDGNYKNWQSFHDIFISTVHENTSLSPAQKFKYLLGQLRGPAYLSVCHFRVDDANYVEALKRLIRKYDKKKQIVETYIRDFLSLPKISSNPSSSHLMKMFDNLDETIRGLKSLGPKAIERDPWIIYLATEKLDEESKRIWKYETSENEFPTTDELLTFLSKRIDAIGESVAKRSHNPPSLPTTSKSFHINPEPRCPICVNENHKLFTCSKFRNQNVTERRDLIKRLNRCFNCLSDEHIVTSCKNIKSCFKCNKRHNTLLHIPQTNSPQSSESTAQHGTDRPVVNISVESTKSKTMVANYIEPKRRLIAVLPTAEIEIEDGFGNWTKFRALLDSGSTHSFVTEMCINHLKIPRSKANISVETLNNSNAGLSKGVSNLKIRSCVDHSYVISTRAYILPTICSKLPMEFIDDKAYFNSLKPLADPNFNTPSHIDILLGCEHFFQALTDGKVAHMENTLIARNSRFGWIIGGSFKLADPTTLTNGHLNSLHVQLKNDSLEWSNIEKLLQRFWETEELPTKPTMNDEEMKSVNLFNENVKYIDKRISVSLPLIQRPPNLGDSFPQALRRFYLLEKRLIADPVLRESYTHFMNEYLTLGHMEIIPDREIMKQSNQVFYLPHHPVFKTSSSTTKVRVVFDASAKSTSGESLNNNLVVGPTIQDNLIDILIRFRKHRFVLSADIEKMFRQILIHPNDRDYQRIIWREHPSSKIQHFRLTTVTYGTSPAPFLATQSLHYLADRLASEYPLGSEILKRDFYMDDLMSGGETLETALQLQQEIICLLNQGGFNLRKWSANHPALLDNIPIENRELSSWEITDDSKSISVLGIKYDPIQDNFFFRLSLPMTTKFTKRSFLSETSRIFDPLGVLSPVTICLKIMFQSLWVKGIGWDDELPRDIAEKWCFIRNQLNDLTNLKFPRWIYATETLELHGFADASKEAYAAVIYARVVEGPKVHTNLIAAKTRVAPVKVVSIPRLELNAATLLVRLLELVQKSLCLSTHPKIYLYTDSTITLDWLSKPPNAWKTYIANRTSKILSCTNRSQWRHVSSKENPADCATRGILPKEFCQHKFWFNGPEFLLDPTLKPPGENVELQSPSVEPEKFSCQLAATQIRESIAQELMEKGATYRKLTRIIALLLRFSRNLKLEPHRRLLDSLRVSEIQEAEFVIFRDIQEKIYINEIKSIKKSIPLPLNSNLISFFPFLDGHGLMRVGGRLEHANLAYDTKHPVILPADHPIVEQMVRELHIKHLHSGPKLLMSIIAQRLLIPRARNLIKRVIHQCVICLRHRAEAQQQLMGQLPPCRVTPTARAFLQTGIDLAGPFTLKTHRFRGSKTYKSYIVIFVCMATKATTLDLVTDMSTDSFLAALKRFCAVRGIPTDIYCDNGTNLVGAKRELAEFYAEYLNQATKANIISWCTDERIQWHFIPPAAPTFGGLWEATVKAAKFHLRRVIGETVLTYEEFITLIKQIEALLNSRPLQDLHDGEYNPLTPGHFLIGQPITHIPEPDLTTIKINRLSRWQLMQSLLQGFWNRWSLEYLTSLNKFHKWHAPNHQIKPGNLVLLRDQQLPPSKWPLARIYDVHPGKDNLIRVITVKLPNGKLLKRPITKITLLPSFDSNESTPPVCSTNTSCL